MLRLTYLILLYDESDVFNSNLSVIVILNITDICIGRSERHVLVGVYDIELRVIGEKL